MTTMTQEPKFIIRSLFIFDSYLVKLQNSYKCRCGENHKPCIEFVRIRDIVKSPVFYLCKLLPLLYSHTISPNYKRPVLPNNYHEMLGGTKIVY